MGSNGVLGMPHGDGFTDGFNTIQGVRSFDGQIGSWTTPDAYSGEVNDPMSQKSYVWNRGNSVSYSDPSGYWTGPSVDQDLQAVDDGSLFENDDVSNSAAAASGADQKALGSLKKDPGVPSAVGQAAYRATSQYHDATQENKAEYGGRIVCNLSATYCGYTVSPDSGRPCTATRCEINTLLAPVPAGLRTFGLWHTHPGIKGYDAESFSEKDYRVSDYNHLPVYVGTPSGKLMRTSGYNRSMPEFHFQPQPFILCETCTL